MERVKIISGESPVIVIAPHGFDDERTSIYVETITSVANCYGVINLGWEKSEEVDFMKDKADCNNVRHCHEDVVREEFLEPILRFKSKILRKSPEVYIFYIHGMSNRHRILANDPVMDMVIGTGVGTPNSITFDLWKKNFLIDKLENEGFTVYESAQGGPMSGWSRNNMNQLFRKWYHDESVQSIQIEIIYELRKSNPIARRAAEYMGQAILETIQARKFNAPIHNKVY